MGESSGDVVGTFNLLCNGSELWMLQNVEMSRARS